MKLSFFGAAHEVTGSCFLLQACGKNILIDCGAEQGKDLYENQPLSVAAGAVDYVLLTHSHIDHSGRLPILYKEGFQGEIWATGATRRLCAVMLLDSAHIQASEAEWRNRKGARAGVEPYTPAFTVEDAENTVKLFRWVDYNTPMALCPGIEMCFADAGHLLGSASIQLKITEDGRTQTLVFSGDIGNLNQPILRNPTYLTEADYVVMESTYGQRSHGESPEYVPALAEIIQSTLDQGGNLLIPSFAVGRTQEMLYFIRQIKEQGLVKGHGQFPVYVDSPLANEAIQVFTACGGEYFDQETASLLRDGIDPMKFAGLCRTITAEESKQLNFDHEPKVIIAASGMCEAGRIRHHLKHNLWRPESTVLFVGYQSAGTLGRQLVEGAKSVKLFGETISVKARILTLAGVSGHADREGLLEWAAAFREKPRRVFVVHGEDEVCDQFAALLGERLGLTAAAPYNGEVWDLDADRCLTEGNRIRIQRTPPVSPQYARLVRAGEELSRLIERSGGVNSKLLKKLAEQVEGICRRLSAGK